MQPFRGNQKLCIEKRNAQGKLVFDQPYPAKTEATFDEVYRWFFADPACKDQVGSWENLSAWLKARGWHIRAKTW